MSERISQAAAGDYFDKARSVAAAFMIAAAAAAILGSFLDWVTITRLPERIPADQEGAAQPFSGVEANDGWFVVVGGVLMVLCALSMVIRKRAAWPAAAFVVAMVIGAVAIAAYRSIEEIFFIEMRRIGEPDPGIGLLLVAAGGIVGMMASAVGVAASPRRDQP